MVGSHNTITLLVLLAMYSVDASAIPKAPDIENINNLVMDDCINNNTECEYWAGIGECQKNSGYMLEYCKKACNVCVMDDCINNNTECEYWAGIGECQRNPGYMLEYCKKACNVCEPFVHHGYTPFGPQLRPKESDDERLIWSPSGFVYLNNITCSTNEFQCGDGACILKSQKCDHIADCIDAEDEDHCLVTPDLAFNRAVTTSCPDGFDYIESCDKCLSKRYYEDPSRCDNCVVCGGEISFSCGVDLEFSKYTSCIYKFFNTTTCMCETERKVRLPDYMLTDTASRCRGKSIPHVHDCDLCAECPVDDCQTFNRKTCRCLTKFKCRARHAKLLTCSDPKAKYVGTCDKCAACPDKCQWFNKNTCKCQIATSWKGCTN